MPALPAFAMASADRHESPSRPRRRWVAGIHVLPVLMRRKDFFLKFFNLIWVVQSFREKDFALPRPQISGFLRSSRSREEGRLAIVTDVGYGMRWTRQRQARRSNGARTNDADADGEVVWSWRPDAGAKVRGIIPAK